MLLHRRQEQGCPHEMSIEADSKYLHAFRIAIWHHKKAAFSINWIHCSISITIFSYVMTGYRWANSLCTPTLLWLVDSSKSSFVLKQETYTFIRILESQCSYSIVNFFEASIASSSAFFGCFARGITLRHPCLFRSI